MFHFLSKMQVNRKESLKPRVTFCVATYNSGVYLKRTLGAIEAQSYPHFRCLLSDDGSTDETLKICEDYAQRDRRFFVLANRERLGWIGNMNRLLEQDLGEFFVIVSHDDVVSPDFLEKLLKEMQKEPDASVVYADAKIVKPDGSSRILSFDLPAAEQTVTDRFRAAATEKDSLNWYLPYHGLVRASSLKCERRLRRNLAGEYKADKVWILGLALSGKLVRVPEVLWEKTDSPDSVSSRWTYTSRTLAAVQLAGLRFLWTHPAPLKDRLLVSGCLLFGYVRAIAWKLRKPFVRT